MSERKATYHTNNQEKRYYVVRIDGEEVNYCSQCGSRLVMEDMFSHTNIANCLFCDAKMTLQHKIHWKR